MSNNLRREALSVFKQLHRTRLKTFRGDEQGLQFTRQKINDEFRKNKDITNEASIQELIKFAKEVENEVRTTVIQVVEKASGRFEAKITPDTAMLDNVPFGQPVDKSQFRKARKCSDIPKGK
ncbi:complex III assembly factor LYRM7 [Nasonia vitripennis]|uniref:Complex III assembly factor LYRM7 n=1 Tax=Nasonia vitripennis TaxID=7425 RepID=A0A7M7IRH7_NASVI|nr:complex III assembly factor LYRM7 [Nasonia vitripennis]